MATVTDLPPGVKLEIKNKHDDTNLPYPKKGQTVLVHYTGTLLNGTEFDTSHKRGKPFKFNIGKGEVIKGWDLGMMWLRKGEKAKLTCTADFAYGERGHPGVIPPNATLIFEVELVDIL